jgi:hypothetical protein
MYSSLKIASLILVLAVSACNCACFAPRNETDGGPCRNFTNGNIHNILEELRPRMTAPLPGMNIPTLEPLFVELIALDGFEFLSGLDIQMHNISFIGFQRFQVNDLDLNLIGFGIELQLVIPELEISGHHVSNGSLLGLVPVVGSGPVNLTVSNVTFDIIGRLNHTGTEWEASELDMNFTISQLRGAFENLTDNFFNELLNLSAPEILELAWPGLKPTVEGVVAEVVGDFLNSFTMVELMAMIMSGEFDWYEPLPTTTALPPTSVIPTSIAAASP